MNAMEWHAINHFLDRARHEAENLISTKEFKRSREMSMALVKIEEAQMWARIAQEKADVTDGGLQ